MTVSYCSSNVGEKLFSSFKRDDLSTVIHRLSPPIQLAEGWVEDLMLAPIPNKVKDPYCLSEKFPKSVNSRKRVTLRGKLENFDERHELCDHTVFSGQFRATYTVGPMPCHPTTRLDALNMLMVPKRTRALDLSGFEVQNMTVDRKIPSSPPRATYTAHIPWLQTASPSEPDRSARSEEAAETASAEVSHKPSRSRSFTASAWDLWSRRDKEKREGKEGESIELTDLSSGK